MKYITVLLVVLMTLSSCAGVKKKLRTGKQKPAETVLTTTENPIREVEEKLVPINNVAPDPHRYFVIIGSFRNPDNATKFQKQILADGFSSEIILNESGLFRITVLSTDEVNAAREYIRTIRTNYPEYYDTWLLIQIK